MPRRARRACGKTREVNEMENFTLTDMSIRDYARILFKKKMTLAAIFITATVLATAYSFLALPKYEAETQILLVAQKDNPLPKSQNFPLYRPGVEIAFTQSQVIKSEAILEKVVVALDLTHRPRPEGIQGILYEWSRAVSEELSQAFSSLGDQIVTLFTGKVPAPKEKPSALKKEIERLSSPKTLDVRALERTDVVSIKVKDRDAKMAASLANAIAQAYILSVLSSQLEDSLEVYRDEYPAVASLKTKLSEQDEILRNIAAHTAKGDLSDKGTPEVKISKPAVPPIKPYSPKKALNILVAMALSLLAGIAWVFFLETLDQTLKTPKDVSEILKIKTLGSLPWLTSQQVGEAMPLTKVPSPGALAVFRSSIDGIASELFLLKKEKGVKTFVIASADPRDGRTFLALNLAAALARIARSQVLLVDANLRHPTLQRQVKGGSFAGLPGIVNGYNGLQAYTVRDEATGVTFLPTANAFEHPEPVWISDGMSRLMTDAKRQFDFIFFDAPAFKNGKDAVLVSGHADGAIWVVKAYQTRRQSAGLYRSALEEKNIPLLGAVINFRQYEIPGPIYNRL